MKELDNVQKALKQLEKEIETLKCRQAISDEALEHMREIYKVAWIEACYDPLNKRSQESARLIYPHIKALNDEFKLEK